MSYLTLLLLIFCGLICWSNCLSDSSVLDDLVGTVERSSQNEPEKFSFDGECLRRDNDTHSYIDASIQIDCYFLIDQDTHEVSVKIDQTVLNMSAFTFTWYKQDDNAVREGLQLMPDVEISGNKSSELYSWTGGSRSGLVWNNVTPMHIGVYYLQAKSKDSLSKIDHRFTLLIDVAQRPSVSCTQSSPDDFYFEDTTQASISKCDIHGSPPLTTWLQYQECTSLTRCRKHTKILEKTSSDSHVMRVLLSSTENTEIHSWNAENKYGTSKSIYWMKVTDVANGFDISLLPENLIEGNNVTMKCSASPFRFGTIESIQWLIEDSITKQLNKIQSSESLALARMETEFSKVSVLSMKEANISNSGVYACRVIGSLSQANNTIRKHVQIRASDRLLSSASLYQHENLIIIIAAVALIAGVAILIAVLFHEISSAHNRSDQRNSLQNETRC